MTTAIIPVHCISQEYWFIRRTMCSCGGHFVKTLQYAAGLTPPTDIIDTRCERCGLEHRFQFDISSFFNINPIPIDLVRRAKEIDERLYKQMTEIFTQSTCPAMVRTLEYLRGLSEAHDSLALEYVQEALQHFQNQAAQQEENRSD